MMIFVEQMILLVKFGRFLEKLYHSSVDVCVVVWVVIQ